MVPTVLVFSYGKTAAAEIVENVSQSLGGSEIINNVAVGEQNISRHLCNIKTKYFEKQIALVPFCENISEVSGELLESTEAVIAFFESTDETFLDKIPLLCQLVEQNNIQLGLLITRNLVDDIDHKLSYSNIKKLCKNAFDLIELCECVDDDETVVDDYMEIVVALKNHIWSTVDVPSFAGLAAEDEDIENQMEAFENLIANIHNFRVATQNMTRDQLLDEAEKLAEQFSAILDEDV